MFNGRNGRSWALVLLITLLLAGAYYYPLPYFVSQPGEAIELEPLIQVQGGHPEQGSFMLTTIRMGGANVITYALARWNEYMELIDKERILAHYEDEEEYSRYQLEAMETSKDAAIIAAYQFAGKQVNVVNHGIIVTHILADMPARETLQIGDVITHVDGLAVNTSEELIQYIQSKEVGDQVELIFKRGDEEQTVSLTLQPLPSVEEGGEERAGIGIGAVTDRQIEVEPPVEIQTKRIGGPSAGLMFALEIYNQLTEEDITKGYRIAGTGTIDADGRVGRIGGVHQKVVAADRAGADIFFAPNEGGAPESNYQRAVQAAQDIGTQMQIVPVDTIRDAVDYLRQLPEK
ncbi:PDZ domain-containing protein [Caldalkalibacillus uzonensis]|uniref:endopeptidase La n=1 Tax=Caldalkalibacillus uzonensis TaxID=353224 RepID=A0ABU0CSW4_9BACI|nr:SepM family pheromone-processing serine protease [Caldalkalibacillus uzonensis]MDQ0339198.1 PDZ domain-containing protein [Caldalkalibacillus uzonensis]